MSEYMNDDEMLTAERELARLIAVDPSPEFAAKVRTRIEQQPVRVSPWRSWLVVSAAAAAVIVVALVMARRETSVPPPATAMHADRQLPPQSEPAPALRVSAPNVTRTVQKTMVGLRPAEPEIVVDAAFTAAIRRLTLSARPLVADEPRPEAPIQSAVVVAPLTIPEIVVPSGEGNNRY